MISKLRDPLEIAEHAEKYGSAGYTNEEVIALCNRLAEMEKQEPIGMVVGKLGAGLRVSCYFMPDAVSLGNELFTRPAPAADHVSVQEAWEACGGNPGIKATREELLKVLRLMDEAEDEAEAAIPAADLAKLVPVEITHADAPELQEIASSAQAIGIKGAYAGFAVGANWMRAAILRNIEEANR